jgi:hypothetical protein
MKSLRATDIVCASLSWCENRAARGYQPGQISRIPVGLAITPTVQRGANLVSQLKFLCNRLIPINIGILQVIQQPAALTDHHEQPAARTMVLLILLQMFGQMIDSLRQ